MKFYAGSMRNLSEDKEYFEAQEERFRQECFGETKNQQGYFGSNQPVRLMIENMNVEVGMQRHAAIQDAWQRLDGGCDSAYNVFYRLIKNRCVIEI